MYPVKVLGFGDNVVDRYDHLKIMYPGGNAANFAVYAKRFGAERSAYMGIFGSDAAGNHVISSLEEEGVELVKCVQLLGENGSSKNTVIDGDRVFLESNEGGIRGDYRYVLSRFDLEYIRQFDLVHSGNYSFTERELPKIKKTGVAISFDFSDDSTKEYFERVAPWVDYAFLSCSGTDLAVIQEALAWIHSLGPKLVCASRGAAGCVAFDGERFYEQAAVPVKHMADTMGAGDSLLTAFLVSWITAQKEGRADSIQECLHKAAVFASQTCEIDGAWGHGVRYED
ncbi:carbohydrate kinase [Anaerotignum lactatifermentans]|uniref:Carbohydrate kinase n=1 Tax=Anaerotignum lactatifermentans TaxID=160404 RepID=A0ABS2GBK6_9FIRM|nr:PfkB family carbohydrate kinase [Anaerotignum lactatifermentans]MBM6830240.1 carbohydrate kinase [Anaerotignum lactatifermentans]MBM6878836.1 carbohydrate kinase [Anaerotignum lactatifermentans]MBM6951853.1 carbohydrate kinase [Anaerotignum lactatifermentans]